jgi:hypothetical protein
MNDRTMRQLLFTALVLVPDKANPGQTLFMGSFLTASIFPLLDLVVVSLLFTSRRTAVYGYVLNGMLVIYGTVLMTHISLVKLSVEPPQPLYLLLFKSTLPDISLAWADFMVGAALYHLWMREPVVPKAESTMA